MSLSSLRTDRLITRKCGSRSRTLATSSSQREVIQAQGHSGSNQRSTRLAVSGGGPVAVSVLSAVVVVMVACYPGRLPHEPHLRRGGVSSWAQRRTADD